MAARSRDEADDLSRLVAEVLERLEREGESALDEACREHPDVADSLRRRIASLRELGLVATEGGELPEHVGDFRLLERLGAGGMGVVYRARQESLGREVALKLIRPDVLHLPRARERFARETAIVAQLQHPGIVPIYTVGGGGGGADGGSEPPYYAMECVPGCTLAEALARLEGRSPEELDGADLLRAVRAAVGDAGAGPAEDAPLYEGGWEATCLRVVRLVAEAIEHAHGRGVLHRDLKPSNVMLTPGGRVMLLDFGLSRTEGSDSVTREGDRVGSLPYMAPELVRDGARAADRRSDVYALGVTLYQLLTLRAPFEAASVPATMAAILEGRPPRPRALAPSLSWEAETVCLAAMDRDPTRRYATAADLARDLGNALARRPVEARRASAALRARRWVEHRPGAAAAIVLAVLLPTVAALLLAREARRVGDALDLAEEALGAARVEGERAAANHERALLAIDAMLVQVADESLDGVPGVDAARQEILAEATRLYDELARERPEDWEPAFLAARCEELRAGFHFNAARYAEMEPLLLRAARRLEPFLAGGPYDVRRLHAHCLEELGWAAMHLGRPEEGQELRERALEAFRALLREDPSDAALRSMLLNELVHRREEGERGDLDELLALVEPSRELAGPDADVEVLSALANDLFALASWLQHEGRLHEALDYAEQYEELVARLLAADPHEPGLRYALVKARSTVGGLALGLGDEERALETMQTAALGIEELLRDRPGVAKYESRASDVYLNLGAALARQGRLEEALSAYEHAAALTEELLRRMRDAGLTRQLGTTWLNMASLVLALEGDPRAAMEICDLARERFEEACAMEPANQDLRVWLALERNTRANLLLALNRPAEAAEELAPTPELAGHRSDYLRQCLQRFVECWNRAAQEGDPETIERVRAAARELTGGAAARGDVDDELALRSLLDALGTE